MKKIEYFNGNPFIWIKNNNRINKCRRYGTIKICKQCGKEFLVFEQKRKRIYCSRKCSIEAHRIIFKCLNCGKEGSFAISQLKKYPTRGKFCSMTCMWEYCRKYPEKHPLYKTKKYAHGYLISHKKRYAHRYIMEEKLNRALEENEVVHHIDMDKSNNNIENFYLYSSQGEHHKGHWSLTSLVAGLLKNNIIEFKNGKYYRVYKEIKSERTNRQRSTH